MGGWMDTLEVIWSKESSFTFFSFSFNRIRGNFSSASAGEHPVDLGELRFQAGLKALLHIDRLRQARGGNAQRLQGNVAFVQAGHKLAAQLGRQQTRQTDKQTIFSVTMEGQIPVEPTTTELAGPGK